MSEPTPRPVLVTGNPSKLLEARRLLPHLEATEIDLPEIQSLDLDEVLRYKGRQAYDRIGAPVIVEETGLELSALGGFPGPLIKWMLQSVGPEGLARIVVTQGDPRAKAICALLYTDGERQITARGMTAGRLVLPPRGAEGFGWDPVFQPDESSCTYGEMSPKEKDAISHRGHAWRAFARALDAELIET